LRLAIIGDGPILNSLKKIANQKNSKVIFLGAMSNENVSEYLNKSKIFVLNSNYEATSYALIEAKMCGLPTVARSTGGSSILIRPNIDGVIYPTQLNPSLSSAILELLGNEALLAKYGMEARKDAIQRFNEDINFDKIFNILIK
jgi:glycosyltransferase involved in cell wall biosynthesis